jgi:uncharacterized paraquat-inducible protein A
MTRVAALALIWRRTPSNLSSAVLATQGPKRTGKWSMLDVLVVAPIGSSEGANSLILFFIGAIALTALASSVIIRLPCDPHLGVQYPGSG